MSKHDDTYPGEDKDCYASLCDEMNDPGAPDWVESDWDAHAVKLASQYAKEHGLPWPPRKGDYDRFWDMENNPRDYA